MKTTSQFSPYDLNFYELYRENLGSSFNSIKELVTFIFIDLFKALDNEDDIEKIEELKLFIEQFSHHLTTAGWSIPLILSPSFDELNIDLTFNILKTNTDVQKFKELFFNFICYTYYEDEISAKKIKPFILLYEQHQAHHEKTISTQERLLTELENSNLDEKFKFSNRKIIKEAIDKIKIEYQELMPLKDSNGSLIEPSVQIRNIKTLFPNLFSQSRPRQEAINYLVYNLYLLSFDNQKKTYLPTVLRLLERINSFNPKYFENLSLNEKSIRKKINDLKKSH